MPRKNILKTKLVIILVSSTVIYLNVLCVLSQATTIKRRNKDLLYSRYRYKVKAYQALHVHLSLLFNSTYIDRR